MSQNLQRKIILFLMAALLAILLISLIVAAFKKDVKTNDTTVNKSIEAKDNKLSDEPKKPDISTKEKTLIDAAKLKGQAYQQIDTFIKLLNEKQYQEAYSMLNKDYINQFSYSYELFKAKYSFDTNKTFTAKLLESTEDRRYIYEISIYDKLTDSPDKKDVWNIKKEFTVFMDKDIITLADRGIISTQSTDKTYTSSGIEIVIKKIINLVDGKIISLTIRNTNNTILKILDDGMGIYLKDTHGSYSHEMLNGSLTDYTLNPGETKNYLLYYRNAKDLSELNIKESSGNKITYSMTE